MVVEAEEEGRGRGRGKADGSDLTHWMTRLFIPPPPPVKGVVAHRTLLPPLRLYPFHSRQQAQQHRILFFRATRA